MTSRHVTHVHSHTLTGSKVAQMSHLSTSLKAIAQDQTENRVHFEGFEKAALTPELNRKGARTFKGIFSTRKKEEETKMCPSNRPESYTGLGVNDATAHPVIAIESVSVEVFNVKRCISVIFN